MSGDRPAHRDTAALTGSGLFDADWYKATYRDVAMTGMDPAQHYLRYGFVMDRDPGPEFSTVFHRTALRGLRAAQEPLTTLLASPGNDRFDPRAVLLGAYKESHFGSHDRAIALAQAHLPPDAAHTLHILHANRAMAHGDEAGWLDSLNAYLGHFGALPIRLTEGDTLLDRFAGPSVPPVTGGPLVSVIMPAWNAATTLGAAARSILNQSWRNLELLIVDDCSTDGTWSVMQGLAASDTRVRLFRNRVNVGPYVSKNIALRAASGEWVTGHDADDWAMPDRIARHIAAVMAEPTPPRASLTHMIRVQSNGHFDTFSRRNNFAPDGVTRVSSISTLFQRALLTDKLGFWDSVRFGADSEMISRTRAVIGPEFRSFDQIGMICLSAPTSLTNHPEFGVRAAGGLSPARSAYKEAWTTWHKDLGPQTARLRFPHADRVFAAPETMQVPVNDIWACQQY